MAYLLFCSFVAGPLLFAGGEAVYCGPVVGAPLHPDSVFAGGILGLCQENAREKEEITDEIHQTVFSHFPSPVY